MKKNKLYFIILTFFALMISSCSCAGLHVHNYSSPYEHNDVTHWQVCTACNEKFNAETHQFNELNNTCLVCGYVDQVVVVDDETKTMTGLTPHGQAKYTINIPSNVFIIGESAFSNSLCQKVNLNKDVLAIHKDAFINSSVQTINKAEDLEEWIQYGNYYYKYNALSKNEALIDGVFYPTLKEAFDAVRVDDTTITILKTDLTITEPIDVKYAITLEPYYSSCNLNCNFNIDNSGILTIPANITYKGDVKLLLTHKVERSDKDDETVVSTGTLDFKNLSERPEGIRVGYVKDFDEPFNTNLQAVGSYQVINSLLIVPVDHYVFGTFLFDDYYTEIKGLTEFGKTITNLTITNVLEGKDAKIGKNSFIVHTDIKINIGTIRDTHIKFAASKGKFHYLTIGNGITSIGHGAFNNWVTSDVFKEVKQMIAPLISKIYSIDLGDYVKRIDDYAFGDNISLTNVTGGSSLEKIDENVFVNSFNLRSVDFSRCYNLKEIGANTFNGCDVLSSLALPQDGWTIGDKTYFPHTMTSENCALFARSTYAGATWYRNKQGTVYYTKSLDKDSNNHYNNVAYTYTLTDALNNSPDGGTIYLSKDISDSVKDELKNAKIENKSINLIADPSLKDLIYGGAYANSTYTINENKFVTLYNIDFEHSATILLDSDFDSNSKQITNSAGFAMKKKDSGENVVSIRYNDTINNLGIKPSSNNALLYGQNYDAYGLYNFKTNIYDDTKKVTFNIGVNSDNNSALTSLGKEATEITIGNPGSKEYFTSDTTINAHAFKNNENLTKITVSDDITSIGNNAFDMVEKLKSIYIGTNVTVINGSTFSGCTNLVKVDFAVNNKLKEIAAHAFYKCDSLSYVNLNGNTSGWKAGDTSLSQDDLNDLEKTAEFLHSTYEDKNWVRG